MLKAASWLLTKAPASSTCGWTRTRTHPASDHLPSHWGRSVDGSSSLGAVWRSRASTSARFCVRGGKGRFRVRPPLLCASKLRTAHCAPRCAMRAHLRSWLSAVAASSPAVTMISAPNPANEGTRSHSEQRDQVHEELQIRFRTTDYLY